MPDIDFDEVFNSFKSSIAKSLTASIEQRRLQDSDRKGKIGADENEEAGACGPPLPPRRGNTNGAPAGAQNVPAAVGMPGVTDVADDCFYRKRHVEEERRQNAFMNASCVNNNNSRISMSSDCNGNSHYHHTSWKWNNWPTVNEQDHDLFDALDRNRTLIFEVNKLQFELQQVNTTLNMYRDVTREMTNFLGRYGEYVNLRRLENKKGVQGTVGVGAKNGNGNVSDASSSYLRTRITPIRHNLSASQSVCASPSRTSFTDYTWRRNKKKTQATNDDMADQLNEEAFRLARTIKNLLNLQQPDLTKNNNTGIYLDRTISLIAANIFSSGRMSLNITAPSSGSTLSLNISTPSNNTRKGDYEDAASDVPVSVPVAAAAPSALASTNAGEINCSQNNRESRSSVRSSINGSISSSTSSSSKVETDVDRLLLLPAKRITPSNSEGESGFSSINSLQDVGIPYDDQTVAEIGEYNFESDNLTLTASLSSPAELPKAIQISAGPTAATVEQLNSPASHPNNVVGLPLLPAPMPDVHHRWEALSPTSREAIGNRNLSTLSNNGAFWV